MSCIFVITKVHTKVHTKVIKKVCVLLAIAGGDDITLNLNGSL